MKFSEIKKVVMPMVHQRSVKLGLTNIGADAYRQTINDQVWWQIGWMLAGRYTAGHFQVNPLISICQDGGYAQLFEQITGIEVHEPCITKSIGYTTPLKTFKEWDFGTGDIDEMLDDMFGTIKIHAIPFVNRMTDIKEFVDYYKIMEFDRVYLVPIIYYRMGEIANAIKYMEESIGFQQQRPNIYRLKINYEDYCKKLIKMMESEEGLEYFR